MHSQGNLIVSYNFHFMGLWTLLIDFFFIDLELQIRQTGVLKRQPIVTYILHLILQ